MKREGPFWGSSFPNERKFAKNINSRRERQSISMALENSIKKSYELMERRLCLKAGYLTAKRPLKSTKGKPRGRGILRVAK